jgi:hypothetical protein
MKVKYEHKDGLISAGIIDGIFTVSYIQTDQHKYQIDLRYDKYILFSIYDFPIPPSYKLIKEISENFYEVLYQGLKECGNIKTNKKRSNIDINFDDIVGLVTLNFPNATIKFTRIGLIIII